MSNERVVVLVLGFFPASRPRTTTTTRTIKKLPRLPLSSSSSSLSRLDRGGFPGRKRDEWRKQTVFRAIPNKLSQRFIQTGSLGREEAPSQS
jgi:hypothetical protein